MLDVLALEDYTVAGGLDSIRKADTGQVCLVSEANERVSQYLSLQENAM